MYSKTLSELWPQQKISNQHKIRIPLLCWHFFAKVEKNVFGDTTIVNYRSLENCLCEQGCKALCKISD